MTKSQMIGRWSEIVCGVLVGFFTIGCGETNHDAEIDSGIHSDVVEENGDDSDTGTASHPDIDETDGPVVDGGGDVDFRPKEAVYCDKPMFALPDNPGERGPWVVGARTVEIGGLNAEVWYPVKYGLEYGREKHVYDLREYLPQDQGSAVEESDTILQPCDCYRGLPIDDDHGPYPVIIFAHGMSGFKGQSLEFMVHWASRGFIVLSADAPGLGLRNFLKAFSGNLTQVLTFLSLIQSITQIANPSIFCNEDADQGRTSDLGLMLDKIKNPTDDLAFLEGHVDLERIGASGHSAGGFAVSPLGGRKGVKVVIPMAAMGVCNGASLESAVIIGAMQDSILPFGRQQNGYENSPAPKRLIGLAKAGHMAMTSFCPIGAEEGGILKAAENAGVKFNPAFVAMVGPLATDGCEPDSLPAERGWEIINYATSAAFEEVLMCIPERGEQLSNIKDRYPEIGAYREHL